LATEVPTKKGRFIESTWIFFLPTLNDSQISLDASSNF
jgi:hypothetical protein